VRARARLRGRLHRLACRALGHHALLGQRLAVPRLRALPLVARVRGRLLDTRDVRVQRLRGRLRGGAARLALRRVVPRGLRTECTASALTSMVRLRRLRSVIG
jgi:hypothetical protein